VKFLAAVIGSLLITTVSAFGMYGVDGDDWIGFLTDGNQFRARMDQLGFTLGNGTIKGTVGFRSDNGWLGSILSSDGGAQNNETLSFNPTLSLGIGYTSDMIGVGVGYNFTYINRFIQVHTPTLVLNALNNNLRFAVPIQIAITDQSDGFPKDLGYKFTGVGFNNMEVRYLTGIDAFNQIRVYASYRNWKIEKSNVGHDFLSEDMHLQLRLYFLNTQIGNVTVNPYIRIDYATALRGDLIDDNITIINNGYFSPNVNGNNGYNPSTPYEWSSGSGYYAVRPYKIAIKPVLSLAASSDIVSLYFEPSLGYEYSYKKFKSGYNGGAEVVSHKLTWGAYAEMYVRPVQDLEWYFEMDINGKYGKITQYVDVGEVPVYFETTTGITWYLPSLGGDTAQ
uniref:hypothetical protein n=1 Tax=uncultured Brachyspira sp. TaxID=221953 RepID=UPI00262D73FD